MLRVLEEANREALASFLLPPGHSSESVRASTPEVVEMVLEGEGGEETGRGTPIQRCFTPVESGLFGAPAGSSVATMDRLGRRRSSALGRDRRASGAHLELMAVFGDAEPEAGPGEPREEEEGDCYPHCDLSVWMRSCDKEQLEPVQGAVTGTIPSWISGCLLRNGPGRLHVGDEQFLHLFDASALLHRFHISDGQVTYRSRFLRSRTFERNTAARRIVVSEFGTLASVRDPCQTIFQRVSSMFSTEELMTDNAMISIYPYGDQLYALTETPYLFRINPETLETENRVNLMKHVQVVNHTAHPHVMEDGTVYNLGQSLGLSGPAYSIMRFPPADPSAGPDSCFQRAELLASAPARWSLHPSYMHSFCITPGYFVLVEQPLVCSAVGICRSIMQQQPLAAALKWFDEPTRFIVIDRHSNAVIPITYESAPLFFLHTINAYEEADHLVVDLCAYANADMLECMYLEALKAAQTNPGYADKFRGRPTRFVIPLNVGDSARAAARKSQPARSPEPHSNESVETSSAGNVDRARHRPHPDPFESESQYESSPEASSADCDRPDPGEGGNLVTLRSSSASAHRQPDGRILLEPEQLCDIGTETPRIHYQRCNGLKYRYFYAISSDVDGDNPGKLIKVDTWKHVATTWCEEHIYPSEPIFIPSPDGQEEDDGVLLSALLWSPGDERQVALLVLDARTMRELGRSTFHTDSPVPKCLHGWFKTDVR